MQLSLLDQLAPVADRAFSTARRIELDATSWVEHVPDWLSGHHQLMQLLIETADWELHERTMYDRVIQVPRLVAGAPGSRTPLNFYDGRVRRFASRAPRRRVEEVSDLLARMSTLLSVRYGKILDSVTLAHYRGGYDSVAFHGDKMGALRADTVVAIVSVGERRRFLLRPASQLPQATPRLSFQFGGGDLLVMGGACQRDFEHAVPKLRAANSRIAIMFREKIPAPRTIGGAVTPRKVPQGARRSA